MLILKSESSHNHGKKQDFNTKKYISFHNNYENTI